MSDYCSPTRPSTTTHQATVPNWPERFDGDDPSWAVAATDVRWPHDSSAPPAGWSAEAGDTSASAPATPDRFLPRQPQTLGDTGLRPSLVESLILKFLLNVHTAAGIEIANQVALPFRIVAPLLEKMKSEQLIGRAGATHVGDFIYDITDRGRERARRYSSQSTYFGAAPVNLDEYLESVERQSIRRQRPQLAHVRQAYSQLVLADQTLLQIGEALNLGLGFFVYGSAGNGKTTLAQGAIRAYSPTIWIPRAVHLSGEILRLFDPMLHQLAADTGGTELSHDQRWICIRRPMFSVGGDLKLESLDVTTNSVTRISEAPLQMKCNGGVLVFDDFGRYRFSVDQLLNRLIVPLEKRVDCLHLASGRTFTVPFDPFVVFSTNLQPADLVDEAFLRRIPYKFEVQSPTAQQYQAVLLSEAKQQGVTCNAEAIRYLLQTYYESGRYPMRFCHPRDLIRHVKNACEFRQLPLAVTPELLDAAVHTCLGDASLRS